MNYVAPIKKYKSQIRGFSLGEISLPQAFSLPFLKSEGGSNNPLFAIEILMNIPKNYSSVLKEYWGDVIFDMKSWVIKVQETSCDILALKFNIDNENEIPIAENLLKEISKIAKKPLLITGSNKKKLDTLLLPRLAQIPETACIIGIAEQETYKELAKIVIQKNHLIIARTPIDINLAKELNILLIEEGVSPDKILIDTNMGALGYGLDYGYSIIERVKNAGLDGDTMLNMPIVAFVGEEAWKTKEARVSDFDECYGSLKERALAWESATATAIMLAGANILVLWHPEVVNGLKKFGRVE